MIALPIKCLLKYSTAVANQLYFNIKKLFLTAALGLVNLSYRLHLFKCSLHGNKSPLNSGISLLPSGTFYSREG